MLDRERRRWADTATGLAPTAGTPSLLGLRRRSALVVSIVSWLIEQVLGFPPWLALALIFLLPAAEASVFAGFIFPGEVVVFFGGVLANEGRLALWTVILVGSLGAIIGDSIGYEVGRHYGMRLLARLPARLVKPDHVTRAQDLIRRKGGRAIFLGRFTAALATDQVLCPGDVVWFHQPGGEPGEQPHPVVPADFVADGVADDRPQRADEDHRPQGQPALVGEHPTEEDDDLAGKDESGE